MVIFNRILRNHAAKAGTRHLISSYLCVLTENLCVCYFFNSLIGTGAQS